MQKYEKNKKENSIEDKVRHGSDSMQRRKYKVEKIKIMIRMKKEGRTHSSIDDILIK